MDLSFIHFWFKSCYHTFKIPTKMKIPLRNLVIIMIHIHWNFFSDNREKSKGECDKASVISPCTHNNHWYALPVIFPPIDTEILPKFCFVCCIIFCGLKSFWNNLWMKSIYVSMKTSRDNKIKTETGGGLQRWRERKNKRQEEIDGRGRQRDLWAYKVRKRNRAMERWRYWERDKERI